MKKLSILFMLSLTMTSLAGCTFGNAEKEEETPVHKHTYENKWTTNATEHWVEATCEHKGQIFASRGPHVDNDNNNYCDTCGRNLAQDKPDEKEVKSIAISGYLSKKTYEYSDEWDFTGLSVKATTNGGKVYTLDPSEYTLTPGKKYPRNYVNTLPITATYKKDTSISISRNFGGITVADEVYDEAAEIAAYYKDCSLTYSGLSLMNELHRHSFSKHTNFVKYVDTSAYLSKAKDYEAPDLIPGKHKTVSFYTGNETQYSVGSREHVWACADSAGLWPHGTVDSSSYYGGGSDLYHVRPCNNQVNTARGDAAYVDFDDSEFSYYRSSVVEVGDAGPYKLKIYDEDGDGEFARYAEPADEFKGDIARIVAYLYMHYNTNTKTPSSYKSLTGGLDLTKVIGYNTVSKAKEVLKKWSTLDPVDEIEKRRNHTVQAIQGNRNPFVDYPDLMNKVF